MACQGPNLDEAKTFGKQVAEALLDELIKEYKMIEPINLKLKGVALLNADKRWKKAREMFTKSVQELFVEDACNSF